MRKSEHRLEKNFQTHSISERSEFVRTKSRGNVGTRSTAGQHLLTGQRESTGHC